MKCPWCRVVRNPHELNLPLTDRQAQRLRMLLAGEIDQPHVEETHRRTWREILVRLERARMLQEATCTSATS